MATETDTPCNRGLAECRVKVHFKTHLSAIVILVTSRRRAGELQTRLGTRSLLSARRQHGSYLPAYDGQAARLIASISEGALTLARSQGFSLGPLRAH